MLPLPRPDLWSRVPFLAAGALALLAARPAAAAVDLGSSQILMDLELPDENGENFQITTVEQDILEFMNLANCTCGDAVNFRIRFRLEPAVRVPSANEPVEVWVGTSCAVKDTVQQRDLCFEESNAGDVDDLRMVPELDIPVRHLVGPTDTGAACTQADDEQRVVYAIVDESNDGFDEGTDYQANLPIKTDTRPPPAPPNARASGAENAVQIEWERPTSQEEDIRFFQALCARVDDPTNTSGFGSFDQRYLTAREVCGSADDDVCPRLPTSARVIAGPGVDAGDAADAGAEEPDGGAPQGECQTGLPGGLDTLDPVHLCGEAEGSNTSMRVGGLENGVTYHIVLLSIDLARNVTALDLGEATPAEVQDFWEDYKTRGGGAKGGCSVAGAGLGGGLAVAVALGLAFGLRFRSRRRRRGGGRGGSNAAAGGAAVLLVLALSPQLVSAQPWWEEAEQEPVQEAVGPAVPHWGFEFKMGPYFPDVDSEFSGDELGPFEAMYGDGPFLMTQVTVDRYFLYPMGQLGLSLTGGYMKRTARAYALDADGNLIINPDTGRPMRSSDTNTFRLFPTALEVVYRFTELDDRLRIPLVPYGRAGLSYYVWRVTKPGGGVAAVDGDEAFGGSLGWQATAGLAVRAERIDRDAEMSLHNEVGVEHAGLVIEFTYARVDGFGASDKLTVGDATFFGGINFEF